MSLWEYKVITSGKGGFASPALLEKFLNDLGRDEWEIIHFQTPPENFLAFTGLARRSTQRDWTLEDAAAAAAKAEAEKLRAEFEAKFKAAASTSPAAAEERAPSFLEEKVAPDDGFRKPVDTSHDDEPESEEEEKADAWDKLTASEEEDLPTFFDAIKPHMRRNQRGPGMSVGVDYLAKKWDQSEEDLKGALVECGFDVPADEDAKPVYLEYDGDLYWVNVNRRGELWINTKEKPRPVFRPVKAPRVEIEAPVPKEGGGTKETGAARDEGRGAGEGKPETGDRKPETSDAAEGAMAEPKAQNGKPQGSSGGAPLPAGAALLDKIRPHMRRNRRGPGGSGSTTFLARALRTNEAELRSAFAALGLALPASPSDKPVYTEIGNELWWLNLDSRGGLWINGRERKPGETAAAAAASEAAAAAGEGAGELTPLESVPNAAAADAVPAPEVAPSVTESPDAASVTQTPAGLDVLPAPNGAEGMTTQREPTPTATATETAPTTPVAPAEPAAPAREVRPEGGNVLSSVRLLLKETKTGAVAGNVERLAEELGKSVDDVLAMLVGAGLKVPEKPREKPVFVEHVGEILWLNKNAKGELWLNAKATKFADKEEPDDAETTEAEAEGEPSETGDGEKKPARRGGRTRTKKPEGQEKVES